MPVAWLTSVRLSALKSAQALLYGVVDGGLQVGVHEVQQRGAGQLGGDDSAGQLVNM